MIITVDGWYKRKQAISKLNVYVHPGISETDYVSKMIPQVSCSTEAEVLSILLGVELALERGISDAIIRNDCESLVFLINKRRMTKRKEVNLHLYRLFNLISGHNFVFEYISSKNNPAHSI